MAKIEHESWMQHLQDNGWRYGAERDDLERIHPSLRPWDQLTPADQEKTREGVANALRILNRLGYGSTVMRPRSAGSYGVDRGRWVAVTRRGEVTAVGSDSTWTWRNESGETMQGEAGDWRLTNDSGRSWSVAPDIFTSTYQHVAGDRWRRVGHALSRPAVAGEVINSLEGRQTAVEGDWVIRGSKDEEWVTTAEHFAESYELRDSGSRNTTRDHAGVALPAPPAD